MTLSVAMIVRNESKNLRECLESVKDIANEIVVVDTGSTDDTVSIAEEFGATIIHDIWDGDFARSRNIAIGACHCDWILTLDADETVSHYDELQKAMFSSWDGIVFGIRNYFHDGSAVLFDQMMVPNNGEFYPEYSHYAMFPALRMFRNGLGFRYTGRIHEQLSSETGERINTAFTQAVIHHFGKMDSERELKKSIEYFNAAKLQVTEEPDNPQAWFNLMAQASVAQNADIAIEAALKCIELVENPHIVVLTTLAMAYQSKEDHVKALGYLARVLERCPDHALAMTRFPISLCILGKTDDAVEICQYALSVYPNSSTAFIIYAECELFRGNHEEALRIMDEAICKCPNDNLVIGRRAEIVKMLEQPCLT